MVVLWHSTKISASYPLINTLELVLVAANWIIPSTSSIRFKKCCNVQTRHRNGGVATLQNPAAAELWWFR